MNFLQKLKDFIASPTHIRTAGILIALIILAAIPLTVIISQKQQEIRQRALGPEEICKNIDDTPPCTNFQDFQVEGNCPKEASGARCKITNSNGTYNVYGCQ